MEPTPLLPGTLDLLLLKAVSLEPMHGYGIALRLRQISGDVFQIEEGTLYPALQRLLAKGWVAGEWKQTENNRRARYYRLTAAGRKVFDDLPRPSAQAGREPMETMLAELTRATRSNRR